MTVSQSKRMSVATHAGTSHKAAGKVKTASPSSRGLKSLHSHSASRLSNTEREWMVASAGSPATRIGFAGGPIPQASPTRKLRGVTEIELEVWRKALQDPILVDCPPIVDLFETIDYPFKNNDPVWVRSGEDNWYLGRILGKNIRVGQTRQSKQGFYYPVCYGKKMNFRKYCSPLNGDLKPDTKAFRQLLREHGLLEDEDASNNEDVDVDMSDDDSESSDSGSTYSDTFRN